MDGNTAVAHTDDEDEEADPEKVRERACRISHREHHVLEGGDDLSHLEEARQEELHG